MAFSRIYLSSGVNTPSFPVSGLPCRSSSAACSLNFSKSLFSFSMLSSYYFYNLTQLGEQTRFVVYFPQHLYPQEKLLSITLVKLINMRHCLSLASLPESYRLNNFYSLCPKDCPYVVPESNFFLLKNSVPVFLP